MTSVVRIDAATWTHNNHGLFDYESKELKTSSMTVNKNKNLVLQEQDIIEQTDIQGSDCQIGSIIFEGNNIFFKSNSKYQDAFVKLDSNQQQLLQIGDLIKLGRVEYFISEIRNGEDEIQIAKDQFNLDKHMKSDKNKLKQCRFCLVEQEIETEEPNNPILSNLCSCHGHSSYVHYECLKNWINFGTRISHKETQSTVQYNWSKPLECDVCKEPLPARVYVENNEEPFSMIQVVKPDSPYLILEQITRSENLSKCLVLIHTFGCATINIGRGHNSEIRCQDISVSRNHALIKFDTNWFIKDQGSKFGTLRIIQDKLKLTKEIQEIQIGRVLLKIRIG